MKVSVSVYVSVTANDVGQGCYGAMKVRDAFANAYRELRDAVLPQYAHLQPRRASFLGRVLLVPVDVVKYRRLVERRWQLQPACPSPSTLSTASSSSSLSVAEDSSVLAATCSQPPTVDQPADDRHVSSQSFMACTASLIRHSAGM